MKGLHTKEGIQARFQWLKDRFQDSINESDAYMRGMTEAIDRIKAIPSYQDIVIWTAITPMNKLDYVLSSHC